MKGTITFTAAGAGLLLMTGAPVAAQTVDAAAPSPGAAASTGPTSSVNQGAGDIIVTAQKRSERLQDVPISIVTQTGDQLAAAGVTNTRDLAAVTPGLTYSYTGAWSQPALRGVSTSATNPGAESPIAMYLDGIYQPAQTAQIFDLPDVQRVEVLKGPQGTLFGRNATAGAIQIFTQDPTYDLHGKLTTTAGIVGGGGASKSAPHVGINGFVSTGLVPDTLAVSVAGYYDHQDGYLRNLARGGTRYGDVNSALIRGKVLFEPASNVKFMLTGYYARRMDRTGESANTPGRFTVAASVPGAIIAERPWTIAVDAPERPYLRIKTLGGSLRGEIDLDDLGTFTSLTGYTYARTWLDTDIDGGFVSNTPAIRLALCPACTQYAVYQPSRSLSQELNFSSDKFGIFQLTAGVTYFRDRTAQGAIANAGSFFYNQIVKTRSLGAFAELTVTPIDDLTIIGGLRYSKEKANGSGSIFGFPVGIYNRIRNDAWTPRASVRYALSPRTNLFFTYSQGFKTGVTQQPYCVPGITFDCSPANPERLTSYEGGIKTGSRDLSLTASVFHYQYKNLQLLVFDGIGSNIINAATARMTGVDFDATSSLTDVFKVRAGISWLPEAKFLDFPNAAVFFTPTPTIDASGTRLLRAPKVTAVAGIDYNQELANGAMISASANLSYSSRYRWEVTGRFNTGSYATLAARGSYAFPDSPVKVSVYGKNLTNKGFIQGTLLSGSALEAFYSAPREIGLQLELGW